MRLSSYVAHYSVFVCVHGMCPTLKPVNLSQNSPADRGSGSPAPGGIQASSPTSLHLDRQSSAASSSSSTPTPTASPHPTASISSPFSSHRCATPGDPCGATLGARQAAEPGGDSHPSVRQDGFTSPPSRHRCEPACQPGAGRRVVVFQQHAQPEPRRLFSDGRHHGEGDEASPRESQTLGLHRGFSDTSHTSCSASPALAHPRLAPRQRLWRQSPGGRGGRGGDSEARPEGGPETRGGAEGGGAAAAAGAAGEATEAGGGAGADEATEGGAAGADADERPGTPGGNLIPCFL